MRYPAEFICGNFFLCQNFKHLKLPPHANFQPKRRWPLLGINYWNFSGHPRRTWTTSLGNFLRKVKGEWSLFDQELNRRVNKEVIKLIFFIIVPLWYHDKNRRSNAVERRRNSTILPRNWTCLICKFYRFILGLKTKLGFAYFWVCWSWGLIVLGLLILVFANWGLLILGLLILEFW